MDVIALGSFQKKLQFSIPADEVRSELDKAYRDLGRQVRLPGFRPGKAPRNVLEMRFGARVANDVAANFIQQAWSDALDKQAVQPVGRPEVDSQGELAAGQPFEFSITVDVKPDIALDAHTGLEVGWPEATMGDDEVEDAVRHRLESEARLVEVTDRAAHSGDMVLVELTARDGDEVVASEPGTMIRTEADPYYPGVDALVIGMKAGDEKTESIAFPETARTEAIAGRTLDVTAKVMSIQANEIPEATDELAEELGYEGGIAGMRAALRGEIEQALQDAARNQARANVLQVLIDSNPFDVPDGMIQEQLEALVEELRLQAAYRGQDPRNLTFDDAQMGDLAVRAQFAVKGGLILEYVAEKEGIEVSDDDLERKYQEMADERGQAVETIKGYFVRDDAVDELRARLLEEKTLDWLLEHSELVTEPAGPAETAAPEAEAAPAAEADPSILDGKVGDVKAAIERGAHDAHLDALQAAEEAGKARKGVLGAIASRNKAIS